MLDHGRLGWVIHMEHHSVPVQGGCNVILLDLLTRGAMLCCITPDKAVSIPDRN
jgi:hypothetical protein